MYYTAPTLHIQVTHNLYKALYMHRCIKQNNCQSLFLIRASKWGINI